MSDDERNETITNLGQISSKLLDPSMTSGFKDRSKRRLSLPISGGARDTSRKSSVASNDGGGGGEGGGKGRRVIDQYIILTLLLLL